MYVVDLFYFILICTHFLLSHLFLIFIYLIYLFIYLLIYLFIYIFIYLFVCFCIYFTYLFPYVNTPSYICVKQEVKYP